MGDVVSERGVMLTEKKEMGVKFRKKWCVTNEVAGGKKDNKRERKWGGEKADNWNNVV